MTPDLDTSALSTFPGLDSVFWQSFWMVVLAAITVGLIVAIVIDFRTPAGRRLPTQTAQRAVGLFTLLGILAGGGVAMLGTVSAQQAHTAAVCQTLEDAYIIELDDCDSLNIPTSKPSSEVVAFFGRTDAKVPDLDGPGSAVVNVTLVWDGSMLLLAATDDLQ